MSEVYQVGQVVNGHMWTGAEWLRLIQIGDQQPYQLGQVVNGHAWTGGEWLPLVAPPMSSALAVAGQPGAVSLDAAMLEELPAGRPDIAAAISRMGRTLGIKRELRNLADKLRDGESVLEIGRVEFRGHGTLLAVTNMRLLFLREGMVRNLIEEIPLHAVTSAASRRRLANGALAVTVAGNAEVWPMTSATHCARVSEAIRQAMHEEHMRITGAVVPAATSVPSAPVDHAGQLRQLAELRDAGVLTAAEFDAKKAEILARM